MSSITTTSMVPSGFKDSGYKITATAYDISNNVISTTNTQPGLDLFDTLNVCGVFMIDGAWNTSHIFYPLHCSANFSTINVASDKDDAYLVYPGWGFKLYYDSNGTGTASRIYYNTSNVPQIFGVNGWGGSAVGNAIILQESTTTSTNYSGNLTNSCRIYYRGNEVKNNKISTF